MILRFCYLLCFLCACAGVNVPLDDSTEDDNASDTLVDVTEESEITAESEATTDSEGLSDSETIETPAVTDVTDDGNSPVESDPPSDIPISENGNVVSDSGRESTPVSEPISDVPSDPSTDPPRDSSFSQDSNWFDSLTGSKDSGKRGRDSSDVITELIEPTDIFDSPSDTSDSEMGSDTSYSWTESVPPTENDLVSDAPSDIPADSSDAFELPPWVSDSPHRSWDSGDPPRYVILEWVGRGIWDEQHGTYFGTERFGYFTLDGREACVWRFDMRGVEQNVHPCTDCAFTFQVTKANARETASSQCSRLGVQDAPSGSTALYGYDNNGSLLYSDGALWRRTGQAEYENDGTFRYTVYGPYYTTVFH